MECVKKELVTILKVGTNEMVPDIFTNRLVQKGLWFLFPHRKSVLDYKIHVRAVKVGGEVEIFNNIVGVRNGHKRIYQNIRHKTCITVIHTFLERFSSLQNTKVQTVAT